MRLLINMSRTFRQKYQEFLHNSDEGIKELEDGILISLSSMSDFFESQEPAQQLIAKPDKFVTKLEEAVGKVKGEPTPVGISDIEPKSVGEIDPRDNGKLRKVRGYISETTSVEEMISLASFRCRSCGTLTEAHQDSQELTEPRQCSGCEREGPFEVVPNESEYIQYQEATFISDEPSEEGSTEIEIYREGEIVGSLNKGDFVNVTGIVSSDVNSDRTTELEMEVLNTELLEISDIYDISERYYPQESDLLDFITRSRYILASSDSLDETNVKTKIITPLISLLGWNIYSDEVELEYTVDMGNGSSRVDYVLKEDGRVRVCVEAKGQSNRYSSHEGQITSYMRQTGADWGLLTNGEHYQLFKSLDTEAPDEEMVVDCELEALSARLDKLEAIAKDEISDMDIDGAIKTEIVDESIVVDENDGAETEEFDIEVIESGTSQPQRDRIKGIKEAIEEAEDEDTGKSYIDDIITVACEKGGMSEEKAREELENLRHRGEVIQPEEDYYRLV